jgi:hypothetical protein
MPLLMMPTRSCFDCSSWFSFPPSSCLPMQLTEALRHMDYAGRGEALQEPEAEAEATADAATGSGAGAEPSDAVMESPTIVLQPRSARKTGTRRATLDEDGDEDMDGGAASSSSSSSSRAAMCAPTPDARNAPGGVTLEFGGMTATIESMTPGAVRRGRRMGLLDTPSQPARAGLPTPAGTPAAFARGVAAPAPTPMGPRNDVEYAEEDIDYDAMAESGAGASAESAASSSTSVPVPVPPTATRASTRARSRSVSVDRARPAPSTAMQATRKSSRVPGSAAPRAQSVRPSRPRHVVSPDGFLHEKSPRSRMPAQTGEDMSDI